MERLIVFFSLLPFFVFSQELEVPLIGKVKDHSSFIEKVSEDKICDNYGKKHVNRGEEVLITGIKKCTDKGNIIKKYYEVCINGKLYYAEKNWLETEERLYETLEGLSPFQAFWLRIQTLRYEAEELEKDLAAAEVFLSSCESRGIVILNSSIFYSNEFTDTSSLEVEFYNPTNKIIKNIWLTSYALDAVGNKVAALKNQSGLINSQIEGHFKPNEINRIKIEKLWFNAVYARLSQIKLQYMDNSIKVIAQPSEVTPTHSIRRTIYLSYYN